MNPIFQYLLIYWTIVSFAIMFILRVDVSTFKEMPLASISILLLIGPLGWMLIPIRIYQSFLYKKNIDSPMISGIY